MAWALLFFTLLDFCTGATSQPAVTQPASQSVSPGRTTTLSCSKSSGRWNDGVYWIQQKHGQAIRFVHCNGCRSRGAGIPDRFTASASGNSGSLTITNVEAGDEAVYYCYAWSRTAGMIVFGGGTHLTVTAVPGQPPVPPKMHLFPPSQQEIESKNKATLACLVDEFYPQTIEVNWQADGKAISSGVQISPSTKQGDKYVATSYLTLSKSEWDSHETYTCIVTHEGKTFEQVVKKSECP